MRVGAGVVWLVVGLGAATLGLGLISDEPGATAARWYLVIGGAALAIGVGARHARLSDGLLVAASVAVSAVIALHAFAIVAFAYQGLTLLLLAPAVLATVLAAAQWARSSRSVTEPQA